MKTVLDAEVAQLYRALAIELAQVAADVTLPLFRAGMEAENKAAAGVAFDPVTAADRGAEAAIRRRLAEEAPEHGVLGEEYGADHADAEFVWVLDPVDGTRAFVAGLPLWTTLIALRHYGRPILGLIAQPFLDEIYLGDATGSECIARGSVALLRTRTCTMLGAAVIATTDPFLFTPPEAKAWDGLRRASRLARYGCDGYAFARVAAGDLDLVVESGLKAWDVEAAIPLIAGAGGICTDWRGGVIGDVGGQVAAAGDRVCLEQALTHLRIAACRP